MICFLIIVKKFQINMAIKIPNFGNKNNYVVHYRNLQLQLSLGMRLNKIHKILKFNQSDWMKEYIKFNTKKKTNAVNDFGKKV